MSPSLHTQKHSGGLVICSRETYIIGADGQHLPYRNPRFAASSVAPCGRVDDARLAATGEAAR